MGGGRGRPGPSPGTLASGLALCLPHTALMALQPGGRRGLRLLLLLTCGFAAAHADVMDWLWSFSRAAEPPASPPVPVTEDTTAAAPQAGPTEQWTAPAGSELPPERLEAGQGEAPAAPRAPTASPDGRQDVAGVGAEILSLAAGIQSFIQLWNSALTKSTGSAETPAPATPTDPLHTLPGPSSASQDGGTPLWLSSGAPSPPDTQGTGPWPGPTQLPPASGRPRAVLGEPPVSPTAPGSTLSSLPGGSPPWGSRQSPGRPQDLDGKGLSPAAARPGQRHRLPGIPRLAPRLLRLVAGPPGLHAAPWALRSRSPAELSRLSRSALPGGTAARGPRGADPGLANSSVLLWAEALTARGPPGRPVLGRCLPRPPALRVCSRLGAGRTWLPDHLQHASADEALVASGAWGRLLGTRCHRFLAQFLCLLLAPRCGPGPPPAPPPCRQFCEAVQDACWSRLDGGGLPVPCASLPAQEDGRCVFIGPAPGNASTPAPCPRHQRCWGPGCPPPPPRCRVLTARSAPPSGGRGEPEACRATLTLGSVCADGRVQFTLPSPRPEMAHCTPVTEETEARGTVTRLGSGVLPGSGHCPAGSDVPSVAPAYSGRGAAGVDAAGWGTCCSQGPEVAAVGSGQ